LANRSLEAHPRMRDWEFFSDHSLISDVLYAIDWRSAVGRGTLGGPDLTVGGEELHYLTCPYHALLARWSPDQCSEWGLPHELL